MARTRIQVLQHNRRGRIASALILATNGRLREGLAPRPRLALPAVRRVRGRTQIPTPEGALMLLPDGGRRLRKEEGDLQATQQPGEEQERAFRSKTWASALGHFQALICRSCSSILTSTTRTTTRITMQPVARAGRSSVLSARLSSGSHQHQHHPQDPMAHARIRLRVHPRVAPREMLVLQAVPTARMREAGADQFEGPQLSLRRRSLRLLPAARPRHRRRPPTATGGLHLRAPEAGQEAAPPPLLRPHLVRRGPARAPHPPRVLRARSSASGHPR
mmetsp:Transcript_14310/g.35631  ORF Transcript_14310/g.35631 Transcript_14310/m.35631 type:complete len:276 (-) Transcript_14310:713-1540(-)